MASLKRYALALLFLQPCMAQLGASRFASMKEAQEDRFAEEEDSSNKTCTSTSCYRYYSSKTKPYLINSFPDVDYDVGEIYGGNIAINSSNPNRNLFFIFQPSEGPPVDEVTIWLNGGPGCSSLEGFLQENGPFLWQPGIAKPVKNPLAWSRLTNMIWVEQPVGTGFAEGKPTATNEVETAKDFVAFFKNFQTLFGIKNYKIYITGESYAGRYIPYIGAQMLDEKDKTYFNLRGALMYDPCIGDCGIIQTIYPLYDIAVQNQAILNIAPKYMSQMAEASQSCGIQAYFDKYLTFPPPSHQPPPPNSISRKCNIEGPFFNGALTSNPCFNPYHITDYCPELPDPLGANPYFNRADVKKAIHAPLNVKWTECSNGVLSKDTSPLSIEYVLPQVIEATNRVLIASGTWDTVVPTNGTLLAIQNMTWNGNLGFQNAPSATFSVPKVNGQQAQGPMGTVHVERGLAWLVTEQCGHMEPEYQPAATYIHLQWLLGRIQSFP